MFFASRRSQRLLPNSRCGSINRTITQSSQEISQSSSSLPKTDHPRTKGKRKSREKASLFAESWPGWNLVIGIEVHAQIKTRRKLFSNSLAPEHNDAPMNERVSLLDAALPGTLPIINPICVKLAARTALALQAKIQPRSSFDRKHYFYGDLPAGYQITQNYAPFAKSGYLDLAKFKKRIRIKQIQIEQDTAKSTRVGSEVVHDLNRAGMPLLEIVSQPDMTSAEEAGEYVKTLQAVLRSIGASDGMMEAGSFRCDVNVSAHKTGDQLGTRTEIKNLNSVKSIVLAINAEAQRQLELLTSTILPSAERVIKQQTMSFDEEAAVTRPLRTKEGIDDYRYMPDPNLSPLIVEQDSIASLKEDMIASGMAGPPEPDSPGERLFGWTGIRRRLETLLDARENKDSALNEGKTDAIRRDIDVLMLVDAGKSVGWDGAVEQGAVSFFEEAVQATFASSNQSLSEADRSKIARVTLNWLIHDLLGQLTLRHETFLDNPITAEQFGAIISAVQNQTITTTGGKILIRHLLDTQQPTKSRPGSTVHEEAATAQLKSVEAVIGQLGLARSSSEADLEKWCHNVVTEHAVEVEKWKNGKRNVIMVLVGKVIRLSGGTADAVRVKETLESILQGES